MTSQLRHYRSKLEPWRRLKYSKDHRGLVIMTSIIKTYEKLRKAVDSKIDKLKWKSSNYTGKA